MMYLVDSGVWIGAFIPKDRHHQGAVAVLRKISKGELGKVLITDLIFGEVTTYVRRKVGGRQSIEAARALLNSEHVEIIYVDEHTFNAAYHMFERYPGLSFTDAASVAVMRDRGVQQMLSFDKGFDGIQDIARLEAVQ